jgi:hypothetical protein
MFFISKKRKTITLKELLTLILKFQTYDSDLKKKSINQVRIDFNRHGWKIADHAFNGANGKEFYSKYQILEREIPTFANTCIYWQQGLIAPLETFIQSAPIILWPNNFSYSPSSSSYVLSTHRESMSNDIALLPDDKNCLEHKLTIGINGCLFRVNRDPIRKKMDESPWEITYKLKFDEQQKNFLKTMEIVWPKFIDETLQNTIGKGDTQITKTQAQRILIAVCSSINDQEGVDNSVITQRAQKIKQGKEESEYYLKEMLIELDKMFKGYE